MVNLTFIKTNDKWYVDIPYDGDKEDLEMVGGADTMLDVISHGKNQVKAKISTSLISNALTCIKEDENEVGATYLVDSWDSFDMEFNGTIWLCNVTKLVLGNFPDIFYIKINNYD